MICPTCGEEVVAILCRRDRKPLKPEAQEALNEILLAMHNKLAGHPVDD